MMVDGAARNPPNYYEILNLPWTKHAGSNLLPQDLKAAYRRALLQHHPDKLQSPNNSQYQPVGPEVFNGKILFTVDEIAEAFAVLSVPKLRSEYDQKLKVQGYPERYPGYGENNVFRSAFETLDLDELEYDENEDIWFKSCRCGERWGFVIREVDLEEASDVGELLVGCKGCSLWIRVLFVVMEDDRNDQSEKHG